VSNFTVIIPSYGLLAPEMEAETGCRYSAFIPLGGTPLYRHILSQYRIDRARARFVFVLADQAPEFELDQLEDEYSIEIVRISHSASIGETVLAGLRRFPTEGAVVVHMGDTLLDMEGAPSEDAIYVQLRNDLYRWTSIESDKAGRISVLNDRHQVGQHQSQSVCVGLFSFSDGYALAEFLSEATGSEYEIGEPFFAALEKYSKRYPVELRHVARWFDCGHVDTYYESRLGYQNLRHFNTLSYDPMRGQVTKTSSVPEAFLHQVRWYRQVPDELEAFLPRIFESNDGAEPFITMELLSIPTLGDLFTTQRLNVGAWNGVVRTIEFIQSRFGSMATDSALAPQLAESVYLGKTRARLARFTAQRPEMADHWVDYEGECWSLCRVLDTLDHYVEKTGLLNIETLTPIHGDFCFSNLLYDPKVKLVKMIDPRGEFGLPGIYGDRRYDLAKLAHSYSGGYDFIVADRFDVAVDAHGELRVDLRTSDYHTKVRSIFESVLLPDLVVRSEVDAVQSLLFLSMLPLHVDKPRRQMAMLATGLDLYARAWQNAGRAL
jgi:hypothetical protein